MCISHCLLVSNPFISAFIQSDFLGKAIFLALLAASVVSWVVIGYKCWFFYRARKASRHFHALFHRQSGDPMSLASDLTPKGKLINPFYYLYALSKKQAMALLTQESPLPRRGLSAEEMALMQSQLYSGIAHQSRLLESNLFILATIVSLGPFFGLLGTVWGILDTFSFFGGQGNLNSHQFLNGLSLALTTTVLGLLDAIPALIAYNFFKSSARSFISEMESFSQELLFSLDLYTRKKAKGQ